MRKLTRLIILGTLCLLAALVSVDEPYAFTWEPASGASDWESANVAEIRAAEFVTVVGSDPRGFTVSIARNAFRDASVVRITARSMDVGALLGCALMSGNRPVQYQEKNLLSGRTWRDYVFEFGDNQGAWPVDRITFVFKHARTAELRRIRVNEPSVADFFVVQGLRHQDVNFFEPYRIFGYSFTLWCYLLLGLWAAGIAVHRVWKKRKYPRALLAVFFLALFVAYDLRNVYEQMSVTTQTYRDFISPPLGEKRFFWYDDMLGFGEFLDAGLPADAGDIHFFGDTDRFLYFRYLLYPRNLIQARDAAARYNIVYDPDHVALSDDELIVDGRVVAAGGKAIPFTSTSFVYVR
jgi:hypothetical protein